MGIVAAIAVLFFGSIGMVSPTVTAVLAFQNSYCYNNAIHLFFLADTFIYASSFATEWQTGYYRSNIIRCNTTTYAVSKCVATGISSGLAISLGAGLYIIGLCIHQPVISPEIVDIQISVPTFQDLMLAGHPALFFLSYIYVIFLQAMFFSVLGLMASGYLPNKYVAYATPFVAGFIINQLSNTLSLPTFIDPVKLALGRLYGLPTFSVLLIETVVFLIFTTICSILFIRTVKRRVANG